MTFGLANSPSVFQAFVNEVFRDMLNKNLIVYIDDILIYSEMFETHVQEVRAVLQCLIDHQLYAKVQKCEFHQTQISFLGYIISAEGVTMDNGKVEAVVNWPQPTNVKELQRFPGSANFYRGFIRNFSITAAPLTSLLQGGGHHLRWTSESTAAFKQLRNSPQHQFCIIQTQSRSSWWRWTHHSDMVVLLNSSPVLTMQTYLR